MSCLKCSINYYLDSKLLLCVENCPVGFYKNEDQRMCDKCLGCKTCVTSPSTCLSCFEGSYLIETECLSVCPEKFYGDYAT